MDVDRVLTQLSTIGGDIKAVTQSLSNALGGEGEKSIKEMVANTREDHGQPAKHHPDHRERRRDPRKAGQRREALQGSEGDRRQPERDDLQPESGGPVRKGEPSASWSRTKPFTRRPRPRGGSPGDAGQPNQVAKSIEKGEGTLGKLAKDEALYEQTKATMEEARQTFANLKQVTDSIEKGEGTLGKLVKDDTLYTQTKETMDEAKQTLANLNKVSQQIEKGEGTIGKLVKDETPVR